MMMMMKSMMGSAVIGGFLLLLQFSLIVGDETKPITTNVTLHFDQQKKPGDTVRMKSYEPVKAVCKVNGTLPTDEAFKYDVKFYYKQHLSSSSSDNDVSPGTFLGGYEGSKNLTKTTKWIYAKDLVYGLNVYPSNNVAWPNFHITYQAIYLSSHLSSAYLSCELVVKLTYQSVAFPSEPSYFNVVK